MWRVHVHQRSPPPPPPPPPLTAYDVAENVAPGDDQANVPVDAGASDDDRRGGDDGGRRGTAAGFCPSEREKGTILLALLFTKQSDGNTSKNKPRLYPATFYKTNRNIFNSS